MSYACRVWLSAPAPIYHPPKRCFNALSHSPKPLCRPRNSPPISHKFPTGFSQVLVLSDGTARFEDSLQFVLFNLLLKALQHLCVAGILLPEGRGEANKTQPDNKHCVVPVRTTGRLTAAAIFLSCQQRCHGFPCRTPHRQSNEAISPSLSLLTALHPGASPSLWECRGVKDGSVRAHVFDTAATWFGGEAQGHTRRFEHSARAGRKHCRALPTVWRFVVVASAWKSQETHLPKPCFSCRGRCSEITLTPLVVTTTPRGWGDKTPAGLPTPSHLGTTLGFLGGTLLVLPWLFHCVRLEAGASIPMLSPALGMLSECDDFNFAGVQARLPQELAAEQE